MFSIRKEYLKQKRSSSCITQQPPKTTHIKNVQVPGSRQDNWEIYFALLPELLLMAWGKKRGGKNKKRKKKRLEQTLEITSSAAEDLPCGAARRKLPNGSRAAALETTMA